MKYVKGVAIRSRSSLYETARGRLRSIENAEEEVNTLNTHRLQRACERCIQLIVGILRFDMAKAILVVNRKPEVSMPLKASPITVSASPRPYMVPYQSA